MSDFDPVKRAHADSTIPADYTTFPVLPTMRISAVPNLPETAAGDAAVRAFDTRGPRNCPIRAAWLGVPPPPPTRPPQATYHSRRVLRNRMANSQRDKNGG